MEKVRPWCGQPSDRGRLRNRLGTVCCEVVDVLVSLLSYGHLFLYYYYILIIGHVKWAADKETPTEIYLYRASS